MAPKDFIMAPRTSERLAVKATIALSMQSVPAPVKPSQKDTKPKTNKQPKKSSKSTPSMPGMNEVERAVQKDGPPNAPDKTTLPDNLDDTSSLSSMDSADLQPLVNDPNASTVAAATGEEMHGDEEASPKNLATPAQVAKVVQLATPAPTPASVTAAANQEDDAEESPVKAAPKMTLKIVNAPKEHTKKAPSKRIQKKATGTAQTTRKRGRAGDEFSDEISDLTPAKKKAKIKIQAIAAKDSEQKVPATRSKTNATGEKKRRAAQAKLDTDTQLKKRAKKKTEHTALPTPPDSQSDNDDSVDLSHIDPTLLRLSQAMSKREPLESKPEPRGRPEVWAAGRQELCETLPYYKSYHGGCYMNGGTIYSFMFDGVGHCREYIDEDVIIARMGGKMESDRGTTWQVKDHDINENQPQAVLNSIALQNPLVIICGNKNTSAPTKMPQRYCVLDWFKATHVWAERSTGKKGQRPITIKYRFERLDRSKPSWYGPHAAAITEEEKASIPPLASYQCKVCDKKSPVAFLVGRMCLQPKCKALWKLENGKNAPYGALEYHPAFLRHETVWPIQEAPFDLNPGVPDFGQYFGDNLLYMNTRGVVCPKCGRCNARYLFSRWQCDTKDCGWTLTPGHRVVMPPNLHHSPWDIASKGPGLVKAAAKPVVQIQVRHSHGYKVSRYTIPGINGCVIHAKANQSVVQEGGGPDDMFRELQTHDVGLERRAFKVEKKPDDATIKKTKGDDGATAEKEVDPEVAHEAGAKAAEGADTGVAEEAGAHLAREADSQVAKEADSQVAKEAGLKITEEAGVEVAEESGAEVAEKLSGEVAEEACVEVAKEPGVEVAEAAGAEVATEAGADLAEEAGTKVSEEASAKAEVALEVAENASAEVGEPDNAKVPEEDSDKAEPEAETESDSGARMTAFSMNFGMPYKFIASGESRGFDEAVEPIRACRSRLNWALRNFLKVEDANEEFNELLAIAYMEQQKIKYHDDGEAGLGPRIATLSLGGAATMSLRVKAKYFSGVSKTGVFTYEKPLPLPLLISSGYVSGLRSKAKVKDTWEGRLKAFEELQQIKQQGGGPNFLIRSRDLAKELELRRKAAEPILSLHLTHGDIVIMEGEDVQKFLEHEVEPHGCLRYALTCRRILPHHLSEDQLPEYEVSRDNYGYDGSEIRQPGDVEGVQW